MSTSDGSHMEPDWDEWDTQPDAEDPVLDSWEKSSSVNFWGRFRPTPKVQIECEHGSLHQTCPRCEMQRARRKAEAEATHRAEIEPWQYRDRSGGFPWALVVLVLMVTVGLVILSVLVVSAWPDWRYS